MRGITNHWLEGRILQSNDLITVTV